MWVATTERLSPHCLERLFGTLRPTEIRNCGQSFVLGRYCNHLHMAGHQAHSYIRGNSIHHSFQRAVTIHGSHNSLIENNVAYDVMVSEQSRLLV